MNKGKVVLITNIPNQYRIPLFNELHEQLIGVGKDLHVIFGARGYQKRKTVVDLSECVFSYEILASGGLKKVENKTGFMFYGGLYRALKKQAADQIIVAGYSLATIKIWLLSFVSKVDYFIWSGSIENKKSGSNFMRTFQRKLLINRAEGFIAYSTLAKRYFEHLGAKSSKITVVGNTVDVNFFKVEVEKNRNSFVKKSSKHLTYMGYLTPRKNVELLLLVVKELLAFRNDFVLDIIGAGESRLELESFVRENSLEKYVIFHGFKQKEEIPYYLAASNCFLFQTDFDIWGLVLNEAMASGIPCLSSVNAGATTDLIKEGVTGFKVNFAETRLVAQKIDWILSHPDEMKVLGENARNFILNDYSLKCCANKIISTIN